MTGSSFSLLVCLVFLTGFSSCGQDHTNDDTSKPADGGTGPAAAESCVEDLERVKAELVDCQAKLPGAPE